MIEAVHHVFATDETIEDRQDEVNRYAQELVMEHLENVYCPQQ